MEEGLFNVNEMQPWGLTLAQTLCLGIGGVLVLGGWVIATSTLRLGKNILMCGLVVIMGLIFCASSSYAIYQLTR